MVNKADASPLGESNHLAYFALTVYKLKEKAISSIKAGLQLVLIQ